MKRLSAKSSASQKTRAIESSPSARKSVSGDFFRTGSDGSIVQSTYTARNQVDQILLDGSPPVVDYDYNARGLMTSKTYESGGLNSTMTHNARGQVLSVAHSSNAGALEQLSYGYSAVGQRLYMQRADGRGDLYGYDAGTTSWVANEVRTFAYDGWNVIREGVVDTSTGGSAQTQVKRYTWGIDLSGSRQGAGGVGGLLMVEEDNDPSNAASPLTAYYYTNDANGNVTTITDTSGVAVAQYEYDAYGNVVASVGAYATENPYRYSTKYSDDESGWLYYGFRYYMPETGRWASRDPIGEAGGVNLYGFVGNDGVNRVDLLGLDGACLLDEQEKDDEEKEKERKRRKRRRPPRMKPAIQPWAGGGNVVVLPPAAVPGFTDAFTPTKGLFPKGSRGNRAKPDGSRANRGRNTLGVWCGGDVALTSKQCCVAGQVYNKIPRHVRDGQTRSECIAARQNTGFYKYGLVPSLAFSTTVAGGAVGKVVKAGAAAGVAGGVAAGKTFMDDMLDWSAGGWCDEKVCPYKRTGEW